MRPPASHFLGLVLFALAAPVAFAEETFGTYAEERAARILLKHDRYDELEKHLDAVASAGRREGSSKETLDAVMAAIVTSKPVVAHVDSWCAAKPDSAWAHLFRGQRRLELAWEARGGGFANTVTEEQWKRFRALVALAKEDLVRAHELDPKRPYAPTILEIIARAQSDPEAGEKWFEKAIAIEARYVPAYLDRIAQLMPKWGGTQKEMLAFARKHAKSEKEPALAALLVEAHAELAARSKDPAGYYEDAKEELDEALARLKESYPRSPHTWNAAAVLATRRGDRKAWRAAREAFASFDPLAAQDLAHKMLEGREVPVDKVGAVKLLEKAANAGLPGAQRDLGRAYLNAVGVEADPVTAAKWFEKAIEVDDPIALRSLASQYERGLGVTADGAKALELYRRAAQEGDAESVKAVERLAPAEKK